MKLFSALSIVALASAVLLTTSTHGRIRRKKIMPLTKEDNQETTENGDCPDAKPTRNESAFNAIPPTDPNIAQEDSEATTGLQTLHIDPNVTPEDSPDARGTIGKLLSGKTTSGKPRLTPLGPNEARMPVDKLSETYNMNHRRRGVAIIFNHAKFDKGLNLKERAGTKVDRDNLHKTLKSLQFEVRAFNDLTSYKITQMLEECAREDHADADCIVIAVLSHGELNMLYAYDHLYKPDSLWSHFTADKCPSLAGKPKLFFIQACQGDLIDKGVRLQSTTATDSHETSYKIPSHADFLIAYSTVPGYYSWRNTAEGSWFVQALCEVFRADAGLRDLLSMMTRVSRKVAIEFESKSSTMPGNKQIPCVTSMLTRDVYFSGKL